VKILSTDRKTKKGNVYKEVLYSSWLNSLLSVEYDVFCLNKVQKYSVECDYNIIYVSGNELANYKKSDEVFGLIRDYKLSFEDISYEKIIYETL
jgi:hypothetical protein